MDTGAMTSVSPYKQEDLTRNVACFFSKPITLFKCWKKHTLDCHSSVHAHETDEDEQLNGNC